MTIFHPAIHSLVERPYLQRDLAPAGVSTEVATALQTRLTCECHWTAQLAPSKPDVQLADC